MRKSAAKIFNMGHDLFFRKVHKWKLIYNTCWEDPRIDRELMQIDDKSNIVVITSAGCNVLDYLLDGPASIDAVDLNPKQNALLELKLAFLKSCEYDDFFRFFGIGACEDYDKLYKHVRPELGRESRKFWDKKIDYFSPGGPKRSFYYRGAAGTAAWIFIKCMTATRKKMRNRIRDLFDCSSLDAQNEIYSEIERQIWDIALSWIVKQPVLLAMLGVPRAQIRLILDGHPQGILGYVKDRMRHVFTQIPSSDNYFWKVYACGAYDKVCCPNYLKEENFEYLRSNMHKIRTHTDSVSGFLKKNPSRYSHFVLLDHQDWMAHHMPDALDEEWRLLVQNANLGTKILLRSAAFETDFIPQAALESLIFHNEMAERLHLLDRVGTYGCLRFAEVSKCA